MILNGIKFKAGQIIEMECDCNNTITKSINTAIEMCIKFDIEIDLYAGKYLLSIDQDSDLNEKVTDYNNWLNSKKC